MIQNNNKDSLFNSIYESFHFNFCMYDEVDSWSTEDVEMFSKSFTKDLFAELESNDIQDLELANSTCDLSMQDTNEEIAILVFYSTQNKEPKVVIYSHENNKRTLSIFDTYSEYFASLEDSERTKNLKFIEFDNYRKKMDYIHRDRKTNPIVNWCNFDFEESDTDTLKNYINSEIDIMFCNYNDIEHCLSESQQKVFEKEVTDFVSKELSKVGGSIFLFYKSHFSINDEFGKNHNQINIWINIELATKNKSGKLINHSFQLSKNLTKNTSDFEKITSINFDCNTAEKEMLLDNFKIIEQQNISNKVINF